MSDDLTFSKASAADLPYFQRIWEGAYPGDSLYAEIFFKHLPYLGEGYIARYMGEACSMFFALKNYRYHTGDCVFPSVYLYALGTLPGYRGRGCGSRMTDFAAGSSYADGAGHVFLAPGSASLRSWYHERNGAQNIFYHRVVQTGQPYAEGRIREITPETYVSLRRQLLKGTDHMEIPLSAVKLQADFCRAAGGGLYSIEVQGHTGICLGDAEDGHLLLRELLCPEADPAFAAGCMMHHLSCRSAAARTPAIWHTEQGLIEPDCMLLPGGAALHADTPYPYWGFLMD